MTTYAEYQQKIEELQNLAAAARETEAAEGIKKIRQIMNDYGLTLADIDGGHKSKSSKQRTPVPQKYRDDATGQTWTGRGRAPKWLDGKDKSQYLIK